MNKTPGTAPPMPSHSNEKTLPSWLHWDDGAFWRCRHVQRMTPMQIHYHAMLIKQAFFGPLRPYLPDDDSELMRLAYAVTLKSWEKNRDAVLSPWVRFEDEDGVVKWRHTTVDQEWARMEEHSRKKADAGRASGLARRKGTESTPEVNASLGVKEGDDEI